MHIFFSKFFIINNNANFAASATLFGLFILLKHIIRQPTKNKAGTPQVKFPPVRYMRHRNQKEREFITKSKS